MYPYEYVSIYYDQYLKFVSVKSRCDKRFQRAFNACCCVFKLDYIGWLESNWFLTHQQAVSRYWKQSWQRVFIKHNGFQPFWFTVLYGTKNNLMEHLPRLKYYTLSSETLIKDCKFGVAAPRSGITALVYSIISTLF